MAEKVVINSSRVVQEVSIVSQPNITKVYINNNGGGGANFNLDVSELGDAPVNNVNSIVFEGAVVTDLGGRAVKVNITGGGGGTSNQYAQNNILFSNPIGDFFGTSDAPRTGSLTIDTTGAVLGGNACVFYNNSSFSISPTPDLIIGDFIPDELNIIFFLRTGGGYLIANILNSGEVVPVAPAPPTMLSLTEGTIGGIPDAPTDLSLIEGTI